MATARRARSGLTLVELLVSTTFAASVAAFAAWILAGLELSTRVGVARVEARAQARRAADLVAIELRDLNLSAADLEPDVPFAAAELRYRVVSGFSAGEVELDPPRATGELRRIALEDGRIVRVRPGLPPIVLADGVRSLSMTLEGPAWLVIEVGVARSVGPGDEVWGISQVRMHLINQLRG